MTEYAIRYRPIGGIWPTEHEVVEAKDLAHYIEWIQSAGYEVTDVVILPDNGKTAAEATVSVDKVIDYINQGVQELLPEQSAKETN